MNQHDYDIKYGFKSGDATTVGGYIERKAQELREDFCTRKGLLRTVETRIPIIRWIRKYNLKRNLLNDFMAGVTLGIYNIPQGMSYSVLASLAPIYGLYASFFPPLIYSILGSSRLSSIGVFSLTCLMVGNTRQRILPDFDNGTTADHYGDIENLTPVDVVVTLGFFTGVIQIVMALLRLDFLTSYLSDPAVGGFTFGAAFLSFIAQVPAVLGIKLPPNNRIFLKIVYDIINIFEKIGDTNVATLIMSIIAMIFLIASKLTVEKRFMKLGFPFPSELLLLIVATSISYIFDFHDNFKMKIVDDVPTGLPPMTVPRFALFPALIGPALSIAVVAFAITVSMGKIFATKHNYRINPNQELLALGTADCISSFFSVFPTSTSLSRTLVNEGSGAKTQLSGIVSAVIILFVILWIGPLMEALPMCILAVIVIVALRSLFMKITDVPKYWKFSKADVLIWVGTALCTILSDIIEGLAAGIIIALVLLVLRTQWPGFHRLGEVRPRDYRKEYRYGTAKETEVQVFRFDAPLIFTNVELFEKHVRQEVEEIQRRRGEREFPDGSTSSLGDTTRAWDAVILDCSSWAYTDAMGVQAIKELNADFFSLRVLLVLAKLRSSLKIQYEGAGLLNEMHEDQFYPTIEDALQVMSSLREDPTAFFANRATVVIT